MALGGGTFTSTNKTLPGTYHNFVSLAKAAASVNDRGVAAMALELDWGADGDIFTVTRARFENSAMELFGYNYRHEKLKGLRDLFRGAHTLYAYRLNSGEKAACALAKARCSGTRGNSLKIVVRANVDDPDRYDVDTYLDTTAVDSQSAKTVADLQDTPFVVWERAATLEATAGMPLAGGTNGAVDGAAHKAFLDKSEAYSFHTMGCLSTDKETKALYQNHCIRMRDKAGVKFKLVAHGLAADHEGCDNLKNRVRDAGWPESALVYWATGISAGCPINQTNMNHKYDGEFDVVADYTQAELIDALEAGEFVLHRVGNETRVLDDNNSLVSFTAEKGRQFAENQTIRVIDQRALNVARIFNTNYLGRVKNNEAGRISLWSDIVQDSEQLQTMQAIENFDEKDVVVEIGSDTKSVVVTDALQVVGTMAKLYITTTVS